LESIFESDFKAGNNFVPIKQVSKYLKSPPNFCIPIWVGFGNSHHFCNQIAIVSAIIPKQNKKFLPTKTGGACVIQLQEVILKSQSNRGHSTWKISKKYGNANNFSDPLFDNRDSMTEKQDSKNGNIKLQLLP
jgi:hypothetical protein